MFAKIIDLAMYGLMAYTTYQQHKQHEELLAANGQIHDYLMSERQDYSRLKNEYLIMLENYLKLHAQLKDLARLEHLEEMRAHAEEDAHALRLELRSTQKNYLELSRTFRTAVEYDQLKNAYNQLAEATEELREAFEEATGAMVELQADTVVDYTDTEDEEPETLDSEEEEC